MERKHYARMMCNLAKQPNSLKDLQETLRADLSIDEPDGQGRSPLWHAANQNPDVRVIKFLLDHGAKMQREILREAVIANPNPTIALTLLDAWQPLDQTILDEMFVLAAASRNDTELLSELHQRGADVQAKIPMDMYPDVDQCACMWDDDEDGDDDEPLFDEHPVLQNAIVVAIYENPHPAEIVEELLRLGVKCDEPDEEGYAPLLHALDSPEVLRILIDHGADPDTADPNGYSALMLACESENNASAMALIELGSSVKAISVDVETALHLALECHVTDNSDVVRALIAAGADVDARDREGFTPLRLALANCAPQSVIDVLTSAGAVLDPVP